MSESLLNRHASRVNRHDDHAVVLGAADWLHLAAAPAFAAMALLTGFLDGGSPDMLCSASRASPLGGMAVMSYVAHHQEAAAAQVVGVGLISTAVDNVAGAGIGRALNTPAVTLLRTASAHAQGSSAAAGISHVASCRRWSAQLARLLRAQVSVPPPRHTGWSTRRRSPPWPPSWPGSRATPPLRCSPRCRSRWPSTACGSGSRPEAPPGRHPTW